MKRLMFLLASLCMLAPSVLAMHWFAYMEDWHSWPIDSSDCYPVEVYAVWRSYQQGGDWLSGTSRGRLSGPAGDPMVYSCDWCSDIPESQYIPSHAFVDSLSFRLNTGVVQTIAVQGMFLDCDENPFPGEIPSGTFDGCNPMGNSTAIVEDDLPQAFELKQNYPNPFNPTTTISFHLPFTGQVRLVVCNLLGQRVAELVNDQLSAGDHELQLDASNLSSGTYFCFLTSGQHSAVRKMLLLK